MILKHTASLIASLTISLILSSYSLLSFAQENTSYEMDNYIIYYNVFNSTMIPADVAKTYNLVRGNDRVYVNIALVKKTGGNGIAANINGAHRNLMQQKYPLKFIEIKEATAVYYLAPIRFNNEEVLHIDIDVSNLEKTETAAFTITKKLYKN
ncbi:MAG: hypothetical protein ACJAUP_001926 [Cellvibrionaceae bacterium]|jgi:hypothetical protein